ncbi:hypothetical protein [Bradyrhizobium icense]|uniref:hypothetical protein n=1 Tax=Bradyrhizobium icense TaxID=1274631 RepID=UPI0012EAA576|nr:hypothetical protein [Bradyrhizobium icense]
MTVEGGISTAAPPTHFVTHETQVIDHWISDDQLMALSRGGKDKSFDVALAASGASLGFLQNFITIVSEVSASKALAAAQLSGAFAFAIAVTIAGFSFWSHFSTKANVDDLVNKIKSRTHARVPSPATEG